MYDSARDMYIAILPWHEVYFVHGILWMYTHLSILNLVMRFGEYFNCYRPHTTAQLDIFAGIVIYADSNNTDG